ncbi:MAG: hypothetical protein K0S32_22 [Bacteroidetes bacterium]|nr:hypothetical protein [Bacteroidota bacterium]
MLPIRQNQIADLIKSHGFKPTDFEFKPITNEYFNLTYKLNTNFLMTIQDKKHYIKPAQQGRWVTNGETANWETALLRVDYWLNALKENVTIKNPWEEIENTQNYMGEINFESSTEVFTSDEQKNIENKLNQLLLKIETLNVNIEIVNTDINHLNEMSGKISKKDWILLMLGTITGWLFTSLISSDQAHFVWESVKNIFSGFDSKQIANNTNN